MPSRKTVNKTAIIHKREASGMKTEPTNDKTEVDADLLAEGLQSMDWHLPLKLLGFVAKHLVADDLHGTCAQLALTCRAMKKETTKTLYRDFSKWGIDLLEVMPPDSFKVPDSKVSRGIAKARKQWDALVAGEGGRVVELLVTPLVSLGEHRNASVYARLTGTAQSDDPLPSLRVMIGVMPEGCKTDDMPPLGASINASGLYRYGSADLLDIARTIATIYHRVSPSTKKLLEFRDAVIFSVWVDPLHPTSLSLEERISGIRYRFESFRGFIPNFLDIRCNAEVKNSTIAEAFLDMALWMVQNGPRDDGGQPRNVRMTTDRMERILESIKLFQKATKIYPELARVDVSFQIMPRRGAMLPEAEDIGTFLSVIRGIGLTAGRHIPLSQVGTSMLRVDIAKCCWVGGASDIDPEGTYSVSLQNETDETWTTVYEDQLV